MGCCQSENRLEDLGYIKPDMIDKKMYMYSKQPANGSSYQSQDQVYQERVAVNFRYNKKQLSEIRESDPHMESSVHYDGSQTKSAKSNRIMEQFSEGPDTGAKEQSFYKSYQQQLASVQPFIYQDQRSYYNPNTNNQSPKEKNSYILNTIPENQAYQFTNQDMLYQKQQIIQI